MMMKMMMGPRKKTKMKKKEAVHRPTFFFPSHDDDGPEDAPASSVCLKDTPEKAPVKAEVRKGRSQPQKMMFES